MKNKLMELRAENNLTQKNVAKAVDITTSFYGMLEVNKRKPSIDVAYKLALFYHTTIEKIFFCE
ncbi:helix-turn-helix domain-containing protein [Clostridium sp. BJN0001]|uniref:helix-turn-helix transcriptional regulator n=1 Tax=Clostridium sp. BJN0001 TaxID=2930219 RepID=UPI001FD14215|nr:helix-turn-helix domain-containing protein [Clostridium sp. BJN0001]